MAILNQNSAELQIELTFLKQYLSSIETWGDLEWFIYSFIVDECSVSMVRFRTKQALEFMHSVRPSTLAPKGFTAIIFHLIRYFYHRGFLDDANYVIHLFTKEMNRAKYVNYINEHLSLKCYTAIVLVLRNWQEGFELAKKCLRIFELLEREWEILHLTVSKNEFFTFIEKHRNRDIPFEW